MELNRRKKKQMLPSSSRRESSPELPHIHRKNHIGCMSGILHLLSRRHSRRRISSESKKRNPQPTNVELSRSPMLPSAIRREIPGRAPAVVARLMGLEEPLPSDAGFLCESAEEKRRKLLGDLERCDEDLRALKKIIDAVRTAEIVRVNGGSDFGNQELKCEDGDGEQPSPVSVLDGFSSPKNEDIEKKTYSSAELSCHLLHRRIESIRRPPSDHKRLSKDHRRPAESPSLALKSIAGGRWRWRRSNAMVESVGEVSKDAIFEERRELVRVGEDLVDDLVGDLVGQLVIELVENCSNLCLQTIRCKRKLCF